MSIVRAVIYFQLLHLIVGLSVDHCDKLSSYEYKCVFDVSLNNTQFSVDCDTFHLTIYNLDSNIEQAFNEDKILSPRHLWEMCMHRHNATTVRMKSAKASDINSRWIVDIEQSPDDFFCDGSTLLSLTINNNRLNDTRKLVFSSIADCHAQCSTTVEWLNAQNNAFETVFNNSFCGLQGLTSFNMNSNRIKELERDAFINLKSLEAMSLSNNSISVLPPGVFRQQLNTLKNLFLDNNRLDSQSIIELKNLQLLTILHLKGNQIDVLPNDVFKPMTYLSRLHLGDNLINTLQGSLTNLRNLEWLSISANNISVILSEDFRNTIHIKWIDFSHNPITAVEPDFCSKCKNMSYVNIANASLTSVPKFISKSTNLYTLDLSNNKIAQINVGSFDAGEDITSIDLLFNLLTDITNVFTKCTVRRLKLDHNRLTNISFTDFSPRLMKLSVTHNNIHTIDTSHDIIHKRRWSLKNLNLSHNHLNEIADGSFDHLTGLDVLDLEYNNLRHISQNTFKNLICLTQLFLSHNKIQTIEPNAFPTRLQTLHLDNNQLLNFNVWRLDNLSFLMKLSLHGNTWSCMSNSSERLEEWLNKKSRIFEDICHIMCEQPNGTLRRVSQLSYCPETTPIDLHELNISNEINGVNNANVWAWLVGLCVCIVMYM